MGYTVYLVLVAVISSLPPSTFGSNDDDVTTTTPYPYPVAAGTTPDYLGTFLDSLNDLYSEDDSSDVDSSDDDSPTQAPSTGDFPDFDDLGNTTGSGFYPTPAAYYMDMYVDDYYYQYYDDAFVKMEESEGSTALFIEAWQNWVDDGGEMFSEVSIVTITTQIIHFDVHVPRIIILVRFFVNVIRPFHVQLSNLKLKQMELSTDICR